MILQNLLVQKLLELNTTFNIFRLPLKFVEKIHNYEITLDEAIDDQVELERLIFRLNNYKPKSKKKKEQNNILLKSAEELFRARKDIIGFFEKRIFPSLKVVYLKEKKKNQKKKSKEKSEEARE